MPLMPYSELWLNDEFDTYCNQRYQRCQVVSVPFVEGGQVAMWVKPCTVTGKRSKLVFGASHLVEVHPDRKAVLSLDERYEEIILTTLKPELGVRTPHEIMQLTGQVLTVARFKKVLNFLAHRGALIRKTEGKTNRFRLPLKTIGVPVVENYGLRSQRCGWLDSRRMLRTTGKVHPVVKWANGSTSFSSEQLLEPLEDLRLMDKLTGKPPVLSRAIGFVEIPFELLQALNSSGSHGTVSSKSLFAIAVYLELPKIERGYLIAEERNNLLDYLDFHYPAWRDVRLSA